MLCSRFDSTKLVGLNQRLPGAKTIRKPNDGKQYRRDYVGVRGSPVRRPGVGTENLSRMSDPTRIGRPERTLMGHHNMRARAGSRRSCARRISVCRSNVCAVAAPTHVLATIPSSSFAAACTLFRAGPPPNYLGGLNPSSSLLSPAVIERDETRRLCGGRRWLGSKLLETEHGNLFFSIVFIKIL